MTSPSPLFYNTYYHIYNRGINRENIFFQDSNYVHFLNLYEKYIDPVADTLAYGLLRNHFHLLVRIKSVNEIIFPRTYADPPNLDNYASKKFSDFFNAYAKAINAAYKRTGSLFQHPFGRVIVTNDIQFYRVIAYIHQNPQKHGLVEDFRQWKHSSYGTILGEKSTRLKREIVLEFFGGKQQYIKLHKEWVTEQQSKTFCRNDLN